MNKRIHKNNPLLWLTTVAVGSGLALLYLRMFHLFYLLPNFQGITTGAEEESLYAIWKQMHNSTVYSDPREIPFAASFFNWLFYLSYGSLARLVLQLFALPDSLFPLLGRLITYFFALLGSTFAYGVFGYIRGLQELRAFRALLALFCFICPLTGFTPITVRPDIAALALEIAGFYFFLRFRSQSQVVLADLALLVFAYLAWSFKQHNIGFLLVVTFQLMLSRKIGESLIILSSFAVLCLLTLMIGGPVYQYLVLVSPLQAPFTIMGGLRLVLLAAAFSPAAFTFGVASACVHSPDPDPLKLRYYLKSSVLVLLPFAVLSSMKELAAENYFFELHFFLIMGCALGFDYLERHSSKKLKALWIGSWAVTSIVSIALVSRNGCESMAWQDKVVKRIGLCAQTVNNPILVSPVYAALPWNVKQPQSFIISSNYDYIRDAGEKLEREGIEGLIASGYFKTIISADPYEQDKLPCRKTIPSAECSGLYLYSCS